MISLLQQFAVLPADLQQEVLDFMSFVAKKRGIELDHPLGVKPRWLRAVRRGTGSGESISDTVHRLRQEESW